MSLFAYFSPSFCAEAPKFIEVKNSAGFPHWPKVLNYPPAAHFATQTLTKFAKSSDTCSNHTSYAQFKEYVQVQDTAGRMTVEVVTRDVFETAKKHLGALHWKLYHVIEVMQNAVHLNTLGGVLIALGALGVYLTQPQTINEAEPPKRNWSRIFSYGSLMTGLALIAFATYRLQSQVTLSMKNFEVVPIQ